MTRVPHRIRRVFEGRGLHIFDITVTILALLAVTIWSGFTLASTNLTQTDDTATVASPEEVLGGFNAPGTATSSTVVHGTGTDADVRLEASAGTPVSTEYTAVGTHSWTAPANATAVTIELWGGGGTGSGDTGGGGGAYAKTTSYAVTAGNSYTVYVGNGGEDSYFINISTALAKKGTDGGSGGQASESIGDVKYSGDPGNTGGSDGQGGYSGSGGAGAGSGGPGTGGAGGTGDDEYNGLPAGNGSQPGGGGGGTQWSGLGGNGAPGQAALTYSLPVYAATGVYKSYVDGGEASPHWSTFTLTKGSTGGGAGTIAVKIKTSASSATPPTFNASGAACDFSISADGSSGSKDLTTCTDLGTGQYLWYQATLTTADTNASPLLEEVVVALTTDTTAPVITLIGEATVSLTVGDAYADAGATATDAVDGDLTANIVTAGSVDTAAPGTYSITYSVSDAAGNTATPVTRAVTVVAPQSSGSISHSNSRSVSPESATVPVPETPSTAPAALPETEPAVDQVEPEAAEVLVEKPVETVSADPPASVETERKTGEAPESSGSTSLIREAADAFLKDVVAPVQAAAEVGQQIAKETADVAAPVAAPVGLAAAATALASGTVSATLSMIGTALFQVGALAALYLAVTQPSLLTAGIVLMYILVTLMRHGSGGAGRSIWSALHGSRK